MRDSSLARDNKIYPVPYNDTTGNAVLPCLPVNAEEKVGKASSCRVHVSFQHMQQIAGGLRGRILWNALFHSLNSTPAIAGGKTAHVRKEQLIYYYKQKQVL